MGGGSALPGLPELIAKARSVAHNSAGLRPFARDRFVSGRAACVRLRGRTSGLAPVRALCSLLFLIEGAAQMVRVTPVHSISFDCFQRRPSLRHLLLFPCPDRRLSFCSWLSMF